MLLLLPAALAAQDVHSAHVIPVIPLELLERPLTIRGGIGTAHDAVSTSSAEAQAFYDQGLAYLHSYVWIEAARSFNAALRADPRLAVAHVGLSYAYLELNRVDASRKALAQAQAMASGVPNHDRTHIELRSLQAAAEDSPRETGKLAAYRASLDAAVAAFPSDVEFLLLRGIAESPDPADRGQGSPASSAGYFVRAVKAEPTHFAAHHYLTHVYENSGRVNDALEEGRVFASLSPKVPHARHMHGHNLRRVGRVAEAIAEFEAADRLQRDYFASEKVPPEYDWHHHHNLDLLATSYQYIGQMKKAEALLKASFGLPSNLVVQVFNKREWPVFLRARGRNDEALAAARVLIAHPHPTIQATGHIEAGYALLASRQYAAAAAESNAALRLLRAGAEGGDMAASAMVGLQGEFVLRTADRTKGRQTLEQAAKKWRDAPGPDAWVQALFRLEGMARAAREVGDWEFARQLAQQMIEHDPGYAGAHYAMALSAVHDGDLPGARAEFALAEKAWRQADPGLPELAAARAKR